MDAVDAIGEAGRIGCRVETGWGQALSGGEQSVEEVAVAAQPDPQILG